MWHKNGVLKRYIIISEHQLVFKIFTAMKNDAEPAIFPLPNMENAPTTVPVIAKMHVYARKCPPYFT